MNIANTLIRLRDDLKEWVTNNIIELKNNLRNHSEATETKLEEKISDLSLGVHDGVVYIFHEGKPQGTGIALIGGEEKPFINIVPTLLDTNLTNVFNDIGYKENARVNSTGDVVNIEATYRTTVTGLIPLEKNGDVLHIRGVDSVLYEDGRHVGWCSLWDSTGAFLAYRILVPATAVSTDENGDFTMTIDYEWLTVNDYPTASYIRLQIGEVTDELIITRNQLISVS